MPTYNCAKYVSSAIHCILNQTYKNFEFLIIDDGSTDNTAEIVSSFNDSRIRYILKKHTGLSDSLNFGLEIASFDLIARMDADDLCLPYRIENQISFAKANPQYSVISSWYGVFRDKRINYLVKSPEQHREISKGLLLHSYLCHAATLFNRNFILKNNGYNKGPFEDYELWLRIMGVGKFFNLPRVLYLQRFRTDSLSRKNITDKYKIHYTLQNKYYLDLKLYFNLSKQEEVIYWGWREYFYGDKKKARIFWLKNFSLIKNIKVFIAFFITFLPTNLFIMFKEIRFRYRLIYLLNFFGKEARDVRSAFRNLLKY